MKMPFKYRRNFFANHQFGSGSNRSHKIISGAIDAAVVTGSVAVVALIFALVSHFTFNRTQPHFTSSVKHISAVELKNEVIANYPWKVFWVGPQNSKEFEFQKIVDGVVQITYIQPNGLDVPPLESFIVYSARSEADRMNTKRRINPSKETTKTTQNGNRVVYEADNMTAERIYLKNGIAAIQFPTPQSVSTFKSTADSLVAIN